MSLKYKDANGNWQKVTSFHQVDYVEVEGGITPEGTLEITNNGTYDIAEYEKVKVDIGGGALKVVSIEGTATTEYGIDQYWHKFDLSPYVKEGDNFLLFYVQGQTSNYYTYSNGTVCLFSPEGANTGRSQRLNGGNTISFADGGLTMLGSSSTSTFGAVAYEDKSRNYNTDYQWENLVFMPWTITAKKAILVYAG